MPTAISWNRSSIDRCFDQDTGSQPRCLAHFLQFQGLSQVRSRLALVFLIDLLYSHASHHLICIWAMGANGPLIDAAYATHYEYMRPAFESPGPITHDNYNAHVGDQK